MISNDKEKTPVNTASLGPGIPEGLLNSVSGPVDMSTSVLSTDWLRDEVVGIPVSSRPLALWNWTEQLRMNIWIPVEDPVNSMVLRRVRRNISMREIIRGK